MISLSASPHLSDSELLHLVDGDAGSCESEIWARHALECEDCNLRLERLRRRSARLSLFLAEIQPQPDFRYPTLSARKRLGPPAWLRAAAVLLLVAAGAIFVSPLRARMAEWLATGWSWVSATAPESTPPAAPAKRPGAESGSTLGFTPARPVLRIEMASRQQAGELVLRRVPGTDVTLEMREDEMGEMPLVAESSLQIRNSAGSMASYEVGVPGSVTQVLLRIGDERPRILQTGEIGEGRSVNLRLGQ